MMNIYDHFARYYDADLQDYIDDLSLYHEMARRTGGPLIELMCGTGRLLIPLAEDGYHITGVDISPAMLAIARRRIADHELETQISVVEGDIRTVALPQNHFSLAFVALNSFMHLDDIEEQCEALENIYDMLAPGGILIIDLFSPNPEDIVNEDNRMVFDRSYALDGKQVYKFIANDSDFASQTSYVTYFYDEMDKSGAMTRRVMNFTMRWLHRYELEHLLQRTGFRMQGIYGSYELDSYTSQSARLIAIASRPR